MISEDLSSALEIMSITQISVKPYFNQAMVTAKKQ